MKSEKKRVTLIPYGLLAFIGLYFLDVYVFKFEKDSTGYGITSVLTLAALIVIVIHAIRIIKQFFKDISFQAWKSNYNIKNPKHNKTGHELKAIFYEERQVIESEKSEAIRKARIEKNKKNLEEKVEMERLRNAGRTVLPSEQVSYQADHDSNVASCPKCGSTSITANKKGFSLAKGALGVATVGAYGAIAAGHGKNKVIVTCLKCGHQWKPGKR